MTHCVTNLISCIHGESIILSVTEMRMTFGFLRYSSHLLSKHCPLLFRNLFLIMVECSITKH